MSSYVCLLLVVSVILLFAAELDSYIVHFYLLCGCILFYLSTQQNIYIISLSVY